MRIGIGSSSALLRAPAWKFDLLSAVIGFAAACLIAVLLYRFRARLGKLGERLLILTRAARRFLLAGAEFRYRQSLARSVQSSHLAGRIVDLDEIFVSPRLFAHQPVPEPGPAAQADPDLTYVVPAFADWPELAALYGAPTISLEQALQSPASLLLIGRPGAGKSTILAHIAARLARQPDLVPGNLTPILVHAADIELPLEPSTPKDVAEPLLLAAEARAGLLGGAGMAEHLSGRLKRGECLVLLDGWDDLPPGHQAEFVKWLRAFSVAYAPRANRIIATGPTAEYKPLLALGLVVTPVAGWTPDDFRQLVARWTAAWPKVIAKRRRKPAPGEAEPALIAGWLSSGSRGRTPLEVTLRIWTALEGDVLGPRPADWLASYVARLLPAPDGLRALERAALESLSQDRCGVGRDQLRDYTNVAFALSTGALPMDPADFLESAGQRGGLLVQRAGNRLTFAHPVVAAFLAAAPLAAANKPDQFLRQSGAAFGLALPIYASLGDATPLVAERLQKPADLAFTDLFTVSRWLVDAPSNARWRSEVLRRLAALLMADDKPELLRGRALAALVGARDESVSQLFKNSLAAPDAVARTFAVLGLGATGEPSLVPALAAHLTDPARPVQWAVLLALASIGDPPAVQALTRAMLEGDEAVRKAAAEALALHKEDGLARLREAAAQKNVVTRRAAIFGLRRLGPSDEIVKLLEDLHFNDTQWVVRGAAEEALARLKSPGDHYPRAQTSPEGIGWLVAWAAGRGEGVAPGDPARNALRRALNEGNEDTRIAAALTLGRLAMSEAIPDLQEALKATSLDVREAAFHGLFEISMALGRRITAEGTAPL